MSWNRYLWQLDHIFCTWDRPNDSELAVLVWDISALTALWQIFPDSLTPLSLRLFWIALVMNFGVLLFQYTTFCSHKNSHLWVPDTSEKNLHNVKLSILETIVGIETRCTYDKAIHIPFSVSRFNGFQRYTAAPNKDGRPLKTCPNGVRRLGVQKVLTSIHPRWMCCSVQKRTLWGCVRKSNVSPHVAWRDG